MTTCQENQLRPSGFSSLLSRPLLYRDVERPSAALRVLVIGAIHGDELTSATLAMYWLRFALSDAHEFAKKINWRFIPVANPDGLLASPPRRVNASGVDLNRNFPTPYWQREAPRYWEQRTRRDPRRYPGPKPLSEPESRFIHAQFTEFRPDVIVSIHAPYGVLDYDGPVTPPSRLGRLFLDQVGVFPGSLGNYGGVHRGVPVITIELPHATRPPQIAEMRQMWLDLLRWIEQRIPPPVQTAESKRQSGHATHKEATP